MEAQFKTVREKAPNMILRGTDVFLGERETESLVSGSEIAFEVRFTTAAELPQC